MSKIERLEHDYHVSIAQTYTHDYTRNWTYATFSVYTADGDLWGTFKGLRALTEELEEWGECFARIAQSVA